MHSHHHRRACCTKAQQGVNRHEFKSFQILPKKGLRIRKSALGKV